MTKCKLNILKSYWKYLNVKEVTKKILKISKNSKITLSTIIHVY